MENRKWKIWGGLFRKSSVIVSNSIRIVDDHHIRFNFIRENMKSIKI